MYRFSFDCKIRTVFHFYAPESQESAVKLTMKQWPKPVLDFSSSNISRQLFGVLFHESTAI